MCLLLDMLRSVNTNGSEHDAPPQQSIDWDHFLQLVKHHRVSPEIYRVAKRGTPSIPPHIVQALQHEYKNNLFRMLRLSAEMKDVCHSFTEHGIRTIVLKGPVLGVDLYGDVSLRMSGDIDILVPIHELDSIDRLLGELGYKKDDYINTFLNDWKWRYHHVSYEHPVKRCKLEVHWRLHPGPAKEPGFDELWERKKQSAMSMPKTPIYQLGDEDLLLFLVAHGARHGWSRLRWLTDIDRLCKKTEIDWDTTRRRAHQQWMDHLIGQALWLSIGLLRTPPMADLAPYVRSERGKKLAEEAIFYVSRMVNLHTSPLPVDVSAFHQRHLFALMDVRQKGLYLLSTLLPCALDAQLLPLPKPLHFLYVPLRPILWAWRRTKQPQSTEGGSA